MTNKLTLFLADDQKMLSSALATLLSLESDLELLGTADNGRDALTQILELRPQIALLDIEMPQMTGLEVAQALRLVAPEIKIIILTTFAQRHYFEEAVKHQVNAYLLKDSPIDQLVHAIHEVQNGLTVYAPELVHNMLRAEINPLTERELDVLSQIAQGQTTADIATTLYLSQGTVRNYISSILSKTGAQSRIEALNIARKHHWITK